MLNFLLGVAAAIVLGVVVELATGGIARRMRRLRIRVMGRNRQSSDVTIDGLYMLGEWSPARPLEPSRLRTRYVAAQSRPAQTFLDSGLFERAVAARRADTGHTTFLTGFKIDHRESLETQVCHVELSGSHYAEVRAIESLREEQPDALAHADEAVARNVSSYVRAAVPSSVAANIVVITKDMEILCARRSAAVDNAVGLWTVGVFETMKAPDLNRPGQHEDFYALCQRALLEELGLHPGNDYGQIHISWVGLYRPILRGHVVAVVQVRLSNEELLDRARTSDSSYEHDAFGWVDLNRRTVRAFSKAEIQSQPGAVGGRIRVGERDFIDQARAAILEAWRFRVVLDED